VAPWLQTLKCPMPVAGPSLPVYETAWHSAPVGLTTPKHHLKGVSNFILNLQIETKKALCEKHTPCHYGSTCVFTCIQLAPICAQKWQSGAWWGPAAQT
jgi:hypothetical protein